MMLSVSRKTDKGVTASQVVLFVLVALVLGVGRLTAQNRSTGEIRGIVTDPSGAVVPGVNVTITNTQTGVETRVITNASGVYDALFLVPGSYSIGFAKPGFQSFVRTGIVLAVQTLGVDVKMAVGSVTQQVRVNAAAPLVQTETSQQSITIPGSAVKQLPSLGESWWNYTVLMPGVSGGGEQNASGSAASVNGMQQSDYNFMMNGSSITQGDNADPIGWSANQSDIQEISFDTHNFSAQYGNGGAIFNVILKTGTDHFHGSLYEFDQNSALAARNFFAQGVPPLRWNDFGGTVGGPIKRDKAFFFFDYERQPTISYPISIDTYPTAAMRQGDFSAAGLPTIYNPATTTLVDGGYVRQPFSGNIVPSQDFDPVAAKIQQYFPLPNSPGLVNNYYFTYRKDVTTLFYTGDVDYDITQNNRLEVDYKWTTAPFTEFTPTAPIGDQTRYGENSAGVVTDSWTISPSMVNEFHVGYNRAGQGWIDDDYGLGYPAKLGLPNLTQNAFPNITISGTIPVSIATGTGARMGQLTIQPSDVLTWIKGKHILKFGGEFDRWQVNLAWPNVDSGSFTYNGLFTENPASPAGTGIGYADFLLGQTENWSVLDLITTGARQWQTELFAQDDYKLRPNLTLDLGLRYQMQPDWTEVDNRISNFDPTLLNPATNTSGALWYAGQDGHRSPIQSAYDILSPRIGFAWSPKNNWSVRGSYGTFYLQVPVADSGNLFGTGWEIQGSEASTSFLSPVFTLAQGPPLEVAPTAASRTPSLLNGQSIYYFPYNSSYPYYEEWQFDIQHELRGGILVDAGYFGTRGVHLPVTLDSDQVPPNLIHLYTTGVSMQQYRPYPQYEGISTDFDEGISNYNSLQLSVQKHFADGLQFIGNYTWSKTLDMATGDGGYGVMGVDVWQNAYDPGALYGLSLLDMPQVFTGDFVYQLPVGSGRRFLNRGGILNGFLGGWQVSSVWQVHSGIPFTPIVGTANLDGSLAGTWFPNRVGDASVSNPTVQEWFNPSAFAAPAPGTFGNSGRDVLFGPSWKQVDFGLAKHFAIHKLGEGGDLEIRADAFDLFNTANFGQPNPDIGTPSAGTITSANYSNGNFPYSEGRIIQLGATLTF
jgi:outer membrane receptor protein involved in Fe transport